MVIFQFVKCYRQVNLPPPATNLFSSLDLIAAKVIFQLCDQRFPSTLCGSFPHTLRWTIEVFQRTLKSGCKIENRQLGSANRLDACLAVDLVVA